MKLNKIEKIIIAIILLGLILVGGTFMFVMPSIQEIDKQNKTLDANLKEKADLETQLQRLETIDNDIAEQKKDALKYDGGFYPDLTTYEASEIAMAYLKESGLEAHAISLTELTTFDLSLEYYDPAAVSYPLKEYSASARTAGEESVASVEGEFTDGGKKYTVTVGSVTDVTISDAEGNVIDPARYTDTMKKAYKAAVCKSVYQAKTKQTVAVVEATYEVTGKYSDYEKFVDHIYSLDRATAFDGIMFPQTVEIQQEKGSDTLFVGEDGTVSQGAEANGQLLVEITQELTLLFMCVEPMDSLKTVDADGTSVVVDQRSIIY